MYLVLLVCVQEIKNSEQAFFHLVISKTNQLADGVVTICLKKLFPCRPLYHGVDRWGGSGHAV